MPIVQVPSALRAYTNKQAAVEVPGNTVKEVLRNLSTQVPELRRYIFDEHGEVRNYVNVFVGDEDIRHLNGSATAVEDRDSISIVPAVAGGIR